MSEHHEHTEFLKHCLGYDASADHHEMLARLVRLQYELKIIRQAVWLVGFLIPPVLASLAFSAFLIQNLTREAQHTIVDLLLALLAGLIVSLLVFLLLGLRLRKKLYLQRAACRQQLKNFLGTRLGHTPPP